MKKVAYKISFKDLASFMWSHDLRSPGLLTIVSCASFLIAFGILFSFDIRFNPPEIKLFLLYFVLVSAGVFVVTFLLAYLLAILCMISKANRTFLCEHTISVNEQGLTEETKYGNSETYWNAISSIVKTKTHLLLYVTQLSAHIIPLRAFDSVEDANEFYTFCKEMKAEHLGE